MTRRPELNRLSPGAVPGRALPAPLYPGLHRGLALNLDGAVRSLVYGLWMKCPACDDCRAGIELLSAQTIPREWKEQLALLGDGVRSRAGHAFGDGT